MRMRRKHNLNSRMEKCAHLLVADPCSLRGRWHETFGFDELCLELGCGKGRFICESALKNTDVFFVALEKVENVIVAAAERAIWCSGDGETLQNLRFINKPADNLTEYFAPGEVSSIYINFCDPWPARRHIKRRLTSAGFLQKYNDILQDDGTIHFKTDNQPLFDYSLAEFEKCGFTVTEHTRDLHRNGFSGIMTEYERKFASAGVPICYINAKKS